jgi:hypothetical protein
MTFNEIWYAVVAANDKLEREVNALAHKRSVNGFPLEGSPGARGLCDTSRWTDAQFLYQIGNVIKERKVLLEQKRVLQMPIPDAIAVLKGALYEVGLYELTEPVWSRS